MFRALDEWIRHLTRAVQLKQGKRGRTTYRELRKRGLSATGAAKVAANARGWWHNTAMLIHVALPTRELDALGIPRLGT